MAYQPLLIYQHWLMEINVKKILVSSIFFAIAFGQYNAIDVGTAGARQLRMNGQLNSNFNPASLGYYATPVSEIDTLSLEKELEDTLSITSVDITETSDKEIKKEKAAELDSVESEFSEFDDFEETSEEVFPSDEEIVDETALEIAESTIQENDTTSGFSMSLFNVAFGVGSGTITPDWINNQLFGGKDLRILEQKEKFFDGISADVNIQIPIVSNLPLLNFSFGPNVISLGQVHSYTSINLASALAQLPFKGIESGEELDISSFSVKHISYLPISYSRGFELKPGTIPFGRKSYVGFRSSLLIGLFELHTNTVSGTLNPDNEKTLVDMQIELKSSAPYNEEGDFATPTPSIGLGIDLGLITEIDDNLTTGFSIENLLGSFNWSGGTIYSSNISGELTPEELSESDSLSENLEQNEIVESGSYKTSLPMSIHLSGTYLATDWVTLDGNLRFDIGDSYWASKTPKFSVASEFFPTSKFPLYLGISLGGNNGFTWGTGFSAKTGSIVLDLAFGQEGGMFNSATGFKVGFGIRVEK